MKHIISLIFAAFSLTGCITTQQGQYLAAGIQGFQQQKQMEVDALQKQIDYDRARLDKTTDYLINHWQARPAPVINPYPPVIYVAPVKYGEYTY